MSPFTVKVSGLSLSCCRERKKVSLSATTMSPFTVKVSGLSPNITEAQLRDFFNFCGQISSIQQEEKGNATIAFERSSAAKTALMLDGGALHGSILSVKSDIVHQDDHHPPTPHQHHIEQSDKPRAGIAAEYLAKGYDLTDTIMDRAIKMDQTHGISNTFLSYFQNLDKTAGHHVLGPNQTITGKVQATIGAAAQHARGVDEQRGYSKIAHGYYSKAIKSPFGRQVRDFYTDTHKQILDIHAEALRISNQQKEEAASGNPATVPDADKVSEPVDSKAGGEAATVPDAAKVSEPVESKAGEPAAVSDAAKASEPVEPKDGGDPATV